MGRAVDLLEQFHTAGYDHSVSVNISGLHLIGGDVVGELGGALAGHDIDRSRLNVELTESVLLTDPELAARRLAEIRELGDRTAHLRALRRIACTHRSCRLGA